METEFKKFTVHASPFNPDLISSLMWELNISGIEELENTLIIYSEPDSVSKSDLENMLAKLVKENILDTFSVAEDKVENKNWNEEWEKNLEIIEVTEKIVIKPTNKKYKPKENQIIITIDPKMSFGTGRHQTTKLMLILLEKYFNNPEKVLDVGTGTAILSIAAAKLGAKKVTGIDIDEWCFINGTENVRKNNVAGTVRIEKLEINKLNDNDFDLILANINKNVLLSIKEEIKNKLKKNGLLILSGILNTDESSIVQNFTDQQILDIEIYRMDEWSAIVFRKAN